MAKRKPSPILTDPRDFPWWGRCPDWCQNAIYGACTDNDPRLCPGCGKALVRYEDEEYRRQGEKVHADLMAKIHGT